MSGPASVWIEADGGSRGNPGPAAYGAVLKDAATGETIAERGEKIGRATNNVAEYRGLIAGLELYADHAPEAELEVRMDSKLVVEQMSGRWKIKHPDMRPLALQAQRLAPFGTTYTWVPRERNKHADRLANEALDGKRNADGLIGAARVTSPEAESGPAKVRSGYPGWAADAGPATTLVLVRHGVTDATVAKHFSGGVGGANPGLNDDGRAQIRSVAEWLSPVADGVDAVVSSPVRRTVESAEIVSELLGRRVVAEDGFAEMDFGRWDGLTFAEVREQDPSGLEAWMGDLDVAPGGGESFRTVRKRVLAARDRLLAEHAGRTVVVVSHVTPIKTLVADALGAPLSAVFHLQLSPASVTVIGYVSGDTGPRGSLRLYNARADVALG